MRIETRDIGSEAEEDLAILTGWLQAFSNALWPKSEFFDEAATVAKRAAGSSFILKLNVDISASFDGHF